MKNKLREASDLHDERLQKLSVDYENQLNAKDQIIQRVTETLEDKESIIRVTRPVLLKLVVSISALLHFNFGLN